MNNSIKSEIIRYIESQGEASKSKIEDHLKELHGTTGDCASRRMRELVAEGTLIKEKKEYAGKTYYSYRVAEDIICGKPHNNGDNDKEACGECMIISLGI